MPQYLLSVHHDYDNFQAPGPEEMEKAFRQVDAFNKEVQDAGAWVFAGGLHPPSNASVVRTEGGKVAITDGPFAEAKEHLGGVWVIKAKDLDEALEWARKGSEACMNPVEVRPFADED